MLVNNVSRRGINTTPLVVGNTVFAGHSEENIDDIRNGALFAIDATQSGDVTHTGELWRGKKWFVGKSSPIFVDGKLIAIEDNANLLVVDPKTGKRIARKKLGASMRSSPLYADGKIYVCTTNGRWYRTHGNEHWEFNDDGLMRRRDMSANDVEIDPADRRIQI